MGCALKNFSVGQWIAHAVGSHRVEIAPATTRATGTRGVVFKLDGVFQGFTGDAEAALYHAGKRLKEASAVQAAMPTLWCESCGCRDAEVFVERGLNVRSHNTMFPACRDCAGTIYGDYPSQPSRPAALPAAC